MSGFLSPENRALLSRTRTTPYNNAKARGDRPSLGKAVPRPADELGDLLGSTPAPAPIDMPRLFGEAALAANKQRKRASKYAMLIENQPDAATIASGPASVGQRRRLGGMAY